MSGRSRRTTSKKPDVVPSSVHYVGYVQDEETPEMIMKKFEALEQVMAASKPPAAAAPPGASTGTGSGSGPGGAEGADATEPAAGGGAGSEAAPLTEEQLQEVFRQTSTFRVQDTLGDGFFRDEIDAVLRDSELEGEEDDDEEANEDEFFDDSYWTADGRKKRGRAGRGPADGARRRGSGGRLVPYEVTDTDGYSYVVLRKKVRLPDPEEPLFTRIPPAPIPASWAAPVLPYQDPAEVPAEVKHAVSIETDVLSYDLPSLGSFLAVLMDPPLQPKGEPPRPGWITTQQLAKLRLTKQLVPNGLVFVWVEKELIMDVVKQMKQWDFLYVENFVWVKKTVNNRFVTQPAPYFKRSKLSLHIFRKAVQETLELRHQRSPDVCFDFVRHLPNGTEEKPEFVYQVIETLLPQAIDKQTGKGRLLELWGKKGHLRPGWTTLVQKGG